MNERLEQELAKLEMQLQEKKAQLEKEQSESVSEPKEKEILHQVVGEHIQNEMQSNPEELLAIPEPQPETPSAEIQSWVDKLISVASDSPFGAIKEAVKTKNAALIDAFHDALADNLYSDLVARRKIEQPK